MSLRFNKLDAITCLLGFAITLFGFHAKATDIIIADYDFYEADQNSDGLDDYWLKGKLKLHLPMSVGAISVVTPIHHTHYLLVQQSDGTYTITSSPNSGQTGSVTWTQVVSSAVATDRNEDGILTLNDLDEDGVTNASDLFPTDPTESSDLDQDGIGDLADSDRDGDGFSNDIELTLGSDPSDAQNKPADSDGDAIPNALDSDYTTSGVIYYYVADHLGTPRVLTGQNQAVVWQSDAKPFGENEESGNQIEQPLRFAGQYRDVESGLYYNYHRYYDPSIGRYITSDPIGLRGGLSTYGYSHQNPLYYTDPLGLEALGMGIGPDLVYPQGPNRHFPGSGNNRRPLNGTSTNSALGAAVGAALGLGLGQLMCSESADDGEDWESEYGEYINSPDAGYTDHGAERENDPSRDIGDPNEVRENGEPFRDTDSGATVYVDGNRVIIIGEQGVVTQWSDQTASETSNNVESGKWEPL